MDRKMTRAARAELADVVRRRYSSAASKDKRRILDEFIAATGYHEKSAIRVLNSQPARKHPQTRRRFKEHWAEMVNCLEERPDQTALELLVEFQARYPGRYSVRQLYTLQRRVRAWRHEAVRRLVHHMDGLATDVGQRHG